jgi:hypothetical protein
MEFDRRGEASSTGHEPTAKDGADAPVVAELGGAALGTEPAGEASITLPHKVYGYVISILGALAIIGEQSPLNEKFRIEKGLETLVRTGDPEAVERTVNIVTLPIEVVPAAIVIAAVHSNNPIIGKARNKLGDWQDMGEKRADFRKEIKVENKETKRALVNEKRIAQGKKPKLSKQEKVENKETKRALVNEKRIAQGKKPKLSKQEKVENKETKRALVNEKRIAQGKKPRSKIDWAGNPVVKFLKKELTDLGLALGLGAGIVVFKDALIDRERKLHQSVISAAKAVVEISLVSGRIGYYIAAGTKSAKWDMPLVDYTLHYEQQAQWLIDYGTDTKALMTILLTAYAPGTIYKIWHRLGKREAAFQDWISKQES